MDFPSLRVIEINYHNAVESISKTCERLAKHPERAQLVKCLSFMDDDFADSHDRVFTSSKHPRTPTLLRLLPNVNDLFMSGMNFDVMPDFQAFLAPMREEMKIEIVELDMPHASLDALLEFIDATGLMTRKGTIHISNLHIVDIDNYLLAMDFETPHPAGTNRYADPPIMHGVQLETSHRVYSASNEWTLKFVMKNACDHLFLDILPSSGLPLHMLGTLQLSSPFLSSRVVTRINNVLSYLPTLSTLNLSFGDGGCDEPAEGIPVLQIPHALQLLEIDLGTCDQFNDKQMCSSPQLISWWTNTFACDGVPGINEFHILLGFARKFKNFGAPHLWRDFDSALVGASFGKVMPQLTDENQLRVSQRFYRWAFPRLVDRFKLLNESPPDLEDSDSESEEMEVVSD